MRILIVEDEPPIARDIKRNFLSILKDQPESIHICYSLEDAKTHISKNKIDLCTLDLNLNNSNGFELLQEFSSYPFDVIIVSAYTDQALEAFKYGVLDFVPKPLQLKRFKSAVERFLSRNSETQSQLEILVAKKRNDNILIKIDEILFFSAADNYVEAHLNSGKVHMLNKSMDKLEQILPEKYLRVHRSNIISLDNVESFRHSGGGKYTVTLSGGISLPVSRNKYKELTGMLGKN